MPKPNKSYSYPIPNRGDSRLEAARLQGCLVLQGDTTDEEVLRKAGILRARALTTVLPDDAANVFITLSARSLNEDLVIIARGEIPSTERKLMQAGADRVVLPVHIGAERIAELLLFKEMANLRDSARMEQIGRQLKRIGLDIEIVAAAKASRAAGATVEEVERLAGGSFMIVAVERRTAPRISNRPPRCGSPTAKVSRSSVDRRGPRPCRRSSPHRRRPEFTT